MQSNLKVKVLTSHFFNAYMTKGYKGIEHWIKKVACACMHA